MVAKTTSKKIGEAKRPKLFETRKLIVETVIEAIQGAGMKTIPYDHVFSKTGYSLAELVEFTKPRPKKPRGPSRKGMLDALASGDAKKIAEMTARAKAYADWQNATTPATKIK